MTAKISDAEQPSFAPGYAGEGSRQHEHLAHLIPVRNELFLANSKAHADPFVWRVPTDLAGHRCTAAALHLQQQLEGSFEQ